MVLTKERFRAYTLEEERDREIISVPLNKHEREILDQFKAKIKEKKDATALKLGFLTGSNVIQSYFSGSISVRLFKKHGPKETKPPPHIEEM